MTVLPKRLTSMIFAQIGITETLPLAAKTLLPISSLSGKGALTPVRPYTIHNDPSSR